MRRPDRMTGKQFSAAMKALGMDAEAFALFSGVRRDRVLQWRHDKIDIPIWVPVLLTMAINPEARAAGQAVADHFMALERIEEERRERDAAIAKQQEDAHAHGN